MVDICFNWAFLDLRSLNIKWEFNLAICVLAVIVIFGHVETHYVYIIHMLLYIVTNLR